MSHLLPGRVVVYPGTEDEIVLLGKKARKRLAQVQSKQAHEEAKRTKSDVSLARRRMVFAKDAGRCWYCGKPLVDRWGELNPPEEDAATVDHLVSRFNGGTNALGNLVLSCKACNSAKGSQSVEEFRDSCLRGISPALRTLELLQLALAEGALGPYEGVVRQAVSAYLTPEIPVVVFWGEVR